MELLTYEQNLSEDEDKLIELSEYEQAQANRPKNTELQIVFKATRSGYSNINFSEGKTDGRVSEEELGQVLKALKETPYHRKSIPKEYYFAMLTCIVVFFLALIFSVISASSSDSKHLPWFGVFIACLAFVGTMGLLVYKTFFFKGLTNLELKLRESDFRRVLNRLNLESYIGKEVEWETGPLGAWLKLTLHYKRLQIEKEEEQEKQLASTKDQQRSTMLL